MSRERTRTITWDDPQISAAAVAMMSGLEFIRAVTNGTLPPPPIFQVMGMSALTVEEGLVIFGVTPAEYHYNPIGVVHGGLAATLLDSVMACAIQTTLPQGLRYTTLELKVNLVRAMTTATGPVRGEGRVIYRGNQVATAEGKILDMNGKLYAHGTTTCLILRNS